MRPAVRRQRLLAVERSAAHLADELPAGRDIRVLTSMCGIMDEVKKDDMGQIAFKTSDLQKFFPKSYTPRQMSDTILRLLEQWQRRRQRDQQR